MSSTPSTIKVTSAEQSGIADSEISHLLIEVYVEGGFTSSEDAVSLFDPPEVRKRGIIICARESENSILAGMIVLVSPNSPALRIAKGNEAELHLLAVSPKHRRQGIGRLLVDAAIEAAGELGCSKLILWTQISMESAQRIYESCGFVYVGDMSKNGREFKIYDREIDARSHV